LASKALERGKPNRREMEFAENNARFSEMQARSSAGDGRGALEIYAQLPSVFQRDKLVLLTRLEAANLVGGKAYDEAVQSIRSATPDDPCLTFLLVDYYLAHQQYDEARTAIDRLDRRLGGDSYQTARRAMTYLLEKKYRQAREHAQKAVEAEDTLFLAYCVLLQRALAEKDFDEVSRLLTIMEAKSIMTVSDLTTIPIYADFVKSPQYRAWAKKQKPK
jgi:tetratricopeptide (TPR) repeat protein